MGYATTKLPQLKYEPIDVTTKPINLSFSINALNSWMPKFDINNPTKFDPNQYNFENYWNKNHNFPSAEDQINNAIKEQWKSLNGGVDYTSKFKSNFNNFLKNLGGTAIQAGTGIFTDKLSDNLFGDDTELGRGLGTIFSSGVSSATSTMSNNILKGTSLTQGLSQNVGASVAGAGAGIAGNLIGKGINSLGGDSMLSRGIGQGVATGIGGFGGTVLSNLIKGESALAGFSGMTKAAKTAHAAALATKTAEGAKKAADIASPEKFANTANIVGLAGQVVGSGLQAAFGPSKEYQGKYGNVTQTMDTIYDLGQTAASFMGPYGAIVAGGMALNKGLSNVFGSTDGMTVQDAILGSAWMPAPVKRVNMWGSSKTGDFYRQSWQNSEKANSFMGNACGDLGDRFQRAREEANKTYGTFSHGAKKEAQNNIDFANSAWGKVLAMADQNEYQNIRSQYMSSINNQRYAQNIQGGWTPLYRGKQGMKIFNNATNHNMGMRLLSAAALIDNKQMILCSAVD